MDFNSHPMQQMDFKSHPMRFEALWLNCQTRILSHRSAPSFKISIVEMRFIKFNNNVALQAKPLLLATHEKYHHHHHHHHHQSNNFSLKL